MLIGILLITCLSFLHAKDSTSTPVRPNIEHCTHKQGSFICNETGKPTAPSITYDFNHPKMDKAQCQPLESFEKYTKYVAEMKAYIERGCK